MLKITKTVIALTFTKNLQSAWYYDEHVNLMISHNCHRNPDSFLGIICFPYQPCHHPHTFLPLTPNTLSFLPLPLSTFPRDWPRCPSLCSCNILHLFLSLHLQYCIVIAFSVIYSFPLDCKFFDGTGCVLYKLLYPQLQSSVAFRNTR